MVQSFHLYQDGVEVKARPCQGIVPEPVNKLLGIGCCTDDSGEARPSDVCPAFWNGGLDEIAIFNHAPNPEQVRELYKGPKPSAVTH